MSWICKERAGNSSRARRLFAENAKEIRAFLLLSGKASPQLEALQQTCAAQSLIGAPGVAGRDRKVLMGLGAPMAGATTRY